MNRGSRWALIARGLVATLLVLSLAGVAPSWFPPPAALVVLLAAMFAAGALASGLSGSRDPAAWRWRALRDRFGFQLFLAAIGLFMLSTRLSGIGGDVNLTQLDVDEGRLARSLLHFFATGEIEHTTVEHYPGLYYWYLVGSFLFAYLWGLMAGLGRDLGSLGLPYFVFAGRVAGLIAETGNIALTGLIGKRVGGSKVGLLAAAAVALSPLSITISTQFRNEPGQLLFILASIYCALLALESAGTRASLAAGIFAGVASGIKYSSVFVLLPALFVASFAPSRQQKIARWCNTMVGFVAAIAVTNPFLWLDFSNFVRQLSVEVQMTGAGHWSAVENPAWFYTATLSWAVGWALLALGAMLAAYVLATGCRRGLTVLLFVIPYIWFMSHQPAQFARWVYPLVPLVAVLCCWSLVVVLEKVFEVSERGLGERRARVAVSVVVLLVLAPLLVAGARDISRRLGPNTAVLMAQWIRESPQRGRTMLVPQEWMVSVDTEVQITHAGRYEEILRGFAVNGFERVLVPEPYFGFAEPDRLALVHEIVAERGWWGNQGFDYRVYEPLPLEPSSTTVDIELARGSSRRFLGPEWAIAEGSDSLEVPASGARIFLPPLQREAFRVELHRIVADDGSSAGGAGDPVSIQVNGEPLETSNDTASDGIQVVVSSPYFVPTEAYSLTEITIRPAAPGPAVRLSRLVIR